MLFLDKLKIGSLVQVNLDLSKDRLSNETIEAINTSSIGVISDFKITDGKGIGVILKLSNGKKQWFFENEIDLLDENGEVVKRINNNDNKKIATMKFIDLNFENKITYVYIKKEFVGGCDIVKEMYESGDLKKVFDDKGIKYKK